MKGLVYKLIKEDCRTMRTAALMTAATQSLKND